MTSWPVGTALQLVVVLRRPFRKYHFLLRNRNRERAVEENRHEDDHAVSEIEPWRAAIDSCGGGRNRLQQDDGERSPIQRRSSRDRCLPAAAATEAARDAAPVSFYAVLVMEIALS